MSSTIDNIDCPKCGGSARIETDTDTCESHIWCDEPDCDYDSDK